MGVNLIGSWRLLKMESVDSRGNLLLPWGEKIDGLLIYDREGYMSLQIARLDLDQSSSESFHSYFGTFQIDQADGRVLHKVLYALRNDWNGRTQERAYSVNGDRLTLKSPPLNLETYTELRSVLTYWQRIKHPMSTLTDRIDG